MNKDLEIFRAKLNKLSDNANERTLYPLICEYIQSCTSKYLGGPYMATSEESLSAEDKHIGFPDITVRRNNSRLVGWWEIKLPTDKLDKESFNEQFTKYKDSLENILFTNLREWQLWQWDADGKPQLVDEIMFNVSSFGISEEKKLENFLVKFFEGRPFEARTPKQLALALARKTRLLSKQVEEAFNEDDKESDLVKLKYTFERTLIQDISVHQFANMIAETLAYSLFLAFLEHIHRGNGSKITLQTAIEYLPTNVPVLKDLYELINKVSSTIPVIYKASLALLEQLEASDISRIYQKLVEHKPGEDPVIQFYEPFLKEYDPKEREARGVYYTPKPVVDYIIRSVDWILKNKFGKEKGLADESVQLLDPATGTGTFLMSAIQEIHQNIKDENSPLGDEFVKREFNRVVLNHILKHFYGFELLIAPYAIAHLKLTLEIERLGFDFKLTENDQESDNDRFKVYLANTLDNPDQPPQDFFGFNSIPQESEHARNVKNKVPILAIVGNPPYSNFGQMNQGKWILDLINDYKKGLKEKKINLDDDFIKFIRFAQWKLNKTGQGIFAMITSNTFIDGITHRKMRRSLMNTFDEIYIYNLHGNLRKNEKCPDGSEDENIFDIQTGVSINIFIKFSEKQTGTKVYNAELWGLREYKFNTLINESFNNTIWKEINVEEFNEKFSKTLWGKEFNDTLNYFVNKEAENMYEYGNYIGVNKFFNLNNTGIQTGKDELSIQFETHDIENIINDFKSLEVHKLSQKYSLNDSSGWKVEWAKKDIVNNTGEIKNILYRPFDARFTYFTGFTSGFLKRPRTDVMTHMLKPNLGLLLKRQSYRDFTYTFICNNMCESCVFESAYANNSIFPLYLYKNSSQLTFDNDGNNLIPNLNLDVIREFSKRTGLRYIEQSHGNLSSTYGPEDILDYIYAILHSPNYRNKYSEQLQIDFPRIPIINKLDILVRLVELGRDLINLHLLGNNPFDNSLTIFNESNKWKVTPKTINQESLNDWKIEDIKFDEIKNRVYVNNNQFFDGVSKDVWLFEIGGYQVCDKWLRVRKQAGRSLSTEDIKHYIKICVSLRETIRIIKEIDKAIPEWPLK